MIEDRAALQATQVLHCNLNVADVERAAGFYEHALGLVVRMRSESAAGDSTPMGIDEPTHSIAWFLYDHRGGRESPAVELVEWRDPPTTGDAYGDPTATGIQSLLFAVSSVAESSASVIGAGGTPTGRTASADGIALVDAELLDLDGVRIELIEDPAVAAPTLTGVRVNCADLEESTAWYGALGWQPIGGVVTGRWEGIEATATIQRVTLPTHPFELHLTAWSGADRHQRAHADANARGLFRMALAVDDVRVAFEQARADGRVQVGEPTYVPLPGTPLGGLWVSFFRDPNGVMVELVERVTRAR